MFIKKENYCNFAFYPSEISDNFSIAYFCNIKILKIIYIFSFAN